MAGGTVMLGLAFGSLGTALASRPPLSTVDPSSIYSRVQRSGLAQVPTTFDHITAGPKPTNAWWMNTVLKPSPGDIQGNIFQMPYVLLSKSQGVTVMQPFATAAPAQQAFDQGYGLSFGSVENDLGEHKVLRWDELSVTLGWFGPSGSMSMPLARGSPYVTLEMAGLTPQLQTSQLLGSLQVDGVATSCNAPFEGKALSIVLHQSDTVWQLLAPAGTTWSCTSNPFVIQATSPLTGAVRLAISSKCATGVGNRGCTGSTPDSRAAAQRYGDVLTQHGGCYPVASSVDYSVNQDLGEVTYTWTKKCMAGWDQLPLIQLAWSVHLPLFADDQKAAILSMPPTPFKDIRGSTWAVPGDKWVLNYKLFPDVGLNGPRPIAPDMVPLLLDALRGTSGALYNGSMADKDFDMPLNYQLGVGDTYFSGKLLGRMARIIAVAAELGEGSQPYFQDMVKRLTDRLQVWFDPKVSPNPLLYDPAWGGLIACGCDYEDCWGGCTPHCKNSVSPPEQCPALGDPGANFGNAFYNDHHFHYGYFIYAAAVAARFAPAWEQQWRENILMMIRDYANPSSADASFPLARHKDWFLGFSWASGVAQAVPLGRNQESTSEAINAYYALYAYGASVQAPFAQDLKDFGRLMTAMEAHGTDTYWHVRENSEIYSDYRYKVVGILWENQAEHQTWFGAASYIVSGIQLLPIVPVMEDALKPDWVQVHLPEYKDSCNSNPDCASTGWSWQLCLEQAVLDVQAAKDCLRSLPADVFSRDSPSAGGNSLTNSLHWIATRATSRRLGSAIMV